MLTDTHAHLDYPDFAVDLEQVLERARREGVERVLTIGTDVASSQRAVALADRFPQVYAVVGVHPLHAQDAPADFVQSLRELASHPKVAAIGETGLDFHELSEREGQPVLEAFGAGTTEALEQGLAVGALKSRQVEVFRSQLELAEELRLSVVIHQRDSWQETLRVLAGYERKVRGVFHCFGGTPDQAKEVISRGHFVSFTGILTFKNAHLVRETAAAVPEGSYMVETDCPYLAPEPYRGKRCEPWHTRVVAEKLAAVRGLSLEQVSAATERAAQEFFRLGP